MAKTVDCGRFTAYRVPYKTSKGIVVKEFKHEFIKDAIEQGKVKLLKIKNRFNGEWFYKVPLNIQLSLILDTDEVQNK